MLTASDEVRVMLAPLATYGELSLRPENVGVRTLLRRPLFIAFLLGSFVALTSTGSLVPSLLVSATLCWSFVPLLQLLFAAILIAAFRRGPLPLTTALDPRPPMVGFATGDSRAS